MRNATLFCVSLLALAACDKHDPILPGVRSNIFNIDSLRVLNEPIKNLPDNISDDTTDDCPYVKKSDNTIWNGTDKIYSGFATNNFVDSDSGILCHGGFVYAGLSTGELVKVNPKNHKVAWITDVYRTSNMTGGASILDIVTPARVYGNYVYAGGLGGAFCKISDKTGVNQWCIDIGVEKPFIIVSDVAYVLDTDGFLNAVRLRDGAIYWRTMVRKLVAPKYQDKTIIIGSEKINAADGMSIGDK